MGSDTSEIALHNLSGHQIDNIEAIHHIATSYQSDLRTKLTLHTPGRKYTKLRGFKFYFDMLYSLSKNRKEINPDVVELTGKWLNSSLPEDDIPDKYIWAGIMAFEIYVKELVKHEIIRFRGE